MKYKSSKKKLTISAISCFTLILLFATFNIYSKANSTSNNTISLPKTTSNPKTDFITFENDRIDYWSYSSDESNVTISKYRKYNSDVYIADIKINDARQFKHVYASNSLDGSTKTVIDMTKKYNPIIAINATGFERENNNLPMGTVGSKGQIDYFNNNRPSLVIGYNGMLNIIPKNSSESDYMSYNPFWITSFGPLLINNYTMVQTEKGNTNVPLAPRVAIGQKTNANEFIIIVVDGRSTSSPGVNYYQLATMFQEKGVRVAYNLDGGGSATLTFNGKIINNPSDATGPREVIDSIFIRDIKSLINK